MINYYYLKKPQYESFRPRAVDRLRAVRQLTGDLMPQRTLYETLVLGTWNIRNFDDNRFGDGPRLKESLFYIAEIISAFDIIAIQEICRDLTPWEEVMSILGKSYDMIVTDVTEGPSGNTERLSFAYNTKKVWFRNVAGEIVLPFKQQISDVTKQRQFARTPFSSAFQAGWFKFVLSTVHIYYGNQSKSSPEYKRRVAEIRAVAKFLKDRAAKEKDNYILVGDFNIDETGDTAHNALKDEGFQTFENNVGSNSKRNKFYDQISWIPKDSVLRQTSSPRNQGVLDVFQAVFTDADFGIYQNNVRETLNRKLNNARQKLNEAEAAGKTREINAAKKAVQEYGNILNDAALMKQYYLNTWRTYQISDHLPLWVELDVDFSGPYLDYLKNYSNPEA
ncbi:endonuclease/exonuclease/phosphatase family protein [bacterium]|nr:endonuclease/exonuclease/phosphatase family protein [bacterium]